MWKLEFKVFIIEVFILCKLLEILYVLELNLLFVCNIVKIVLIVDRLVWGCFVIGMLWLLFLILI